MNIAISEEMAEARSIRYAKGITQDQISHKAGFCHNQITRWENGKNHPSIHAYATYLRALGKRIRIEDIPEGEC